VTRDQLMHILWAENALARHYYYPGCHRMEPYSSRFPHAGALLPRTQQILEQVLCLPTGTVVGAEDVQQMCQIIRLVVTNADAVRARLECKLC
jgi:dTDP-4-amino-4,6-dideoxygalactose transaminase